MDSINTLVGRSCLLRRMCDLIRRKHYSIGTKQVYVSWFKRFILCHDKRHSEQIAEPGIERFLSHPASDRRIGASIPNQALNEAWNPKADQNPSNRARDSIDRVGIKINIDGLELCGCVRQARGIWHSRQKLWELSYTQVVFLGWKIVLQRDS